jgi:hypothetical protein
VLTARREEMLKEFVQALMYVISMSVLSDGYGRGFLWAAGSLVCVSSRPSAEPIYSIHPDITTNTTTNNDDDNNRGRGIWRPAVAYALGAVDKVRGCPVLSCRWVRLLIATTTNTHVSLLCCLYDLPPPLTPPPPTHPSTHTPPSLAHHHTGVGPGAGGGDVCGARAPLGLREQGG